MTHSNLGEGEFIPGLRGTKAPGQRQRCFEDYILGPLRCLQHHPATAPQGQPDRDVSRTKPGGLHHRLSAWETSVHKSGGLQIWHSGLQYGSAAWNRALSSAVPPVHFDFQYNSDLCQIQKFVDDTSITGCIRSGQENEDRKLIKDFDTYVTPIPPKPGRWWWTLWDTGCTQNQLSQKGTV